MNELQLRAQEFLEQEVPVSLNRTPGSIAENCIRSYAETGQAGLSPEFAEILQMCLMETAFSAEHETGDAAVYLRENHDILCLILAELKQGRSNKDDP